MKKIAFTLSILSPLAIAAQVIDPQPGLRLQKKHIKDTSIEEKTAITGSRVTFYGLTALNNANDDLIESITASGRLGVVLFLDDEYNFKVNIAANLLNANPRKGLKKDSVDFNSLMFPETGNFGFLFSPSLKLIEKENEHSLWLEGTFAYRKTAIDSPDVSFKTFAYNLGFKYQWAYLLNNENDYLTFSLMPYGNLFNVPDEDVQKFNVVLNDPLFKDINKGAEIWSYGIKTTMQYKNFVFFFDIRRNTGTKGLADDNPLKGTKVNIGFATAFSLKKL